MYCRNKPDAYFFAAFFLLAFLLRRLSNFASRALRRAQVSLVGDGMMVLLLDTAKLHHVRLEA
jgi:hypothetical protein